MSRTPIYLRRGNKVDLPTLLAGEPGFATDTKELFIGATGGNEKIYAPYDKTSAFRANQSSIQTISASVWTKILYQTEAYDHLNEYDTSISRFTAQAAGIYLISAGIFLNTLADQSKANLKVYINGGTSEISLFDWNFSGSSSAGMPQGSVMLKLAANDYLEIFVNCSATSTTATANEAYYMVTRIA